MLCIQSIYVSFFFEMMIKGGLSSLELEISTAQIRHSAIAIRSCRSNIAVICELRGD